MCFRVLLAATFFALAVPAQKATGSCPIECVNGECKPLSSPGHEGQYVCECITPFTGDSCNVQPAAAASSSEPSARSSPQPSATATPRPAATGDNMACWLHDSSCTQTYILLLEDGCNPMLLLVLWTAVVHAICYCYCSHGLPAGTGSVEGTTESCPIKCMHGECKPISSPGHEGHYICECRSPFMGDSCNVQPSPAQATPLVTPVGKSRNYDNCALSQGCRHLHRRMRYVQSN